MSALLDDDGFRSQAETAKETARVSKALAVPKITPDASLA